MWPRLCRVDKYREQEQCNKLGFQGAMEATRYLSGLPWPDDDEEYARRFDVLILDLQLALLKPEPVRERHQKKCAS